MPAAQHTLDNVVEAQHIVDSIRTANECDKMLSLTEHSGEPLPRGYSGWLHNRDNDTVRMGTVTIFSDGSRHVEYHDDIVYTQQDIVGGLLPMVPHPEIGPGEET